MNSAPGGLASAIDHHRAGRFEDAVTAYLGILEIEPGNIDALNNLGAALLDLGRPGEAEIYLARALGLAPEDADILNNIGNAFLAQDKTADAVARFDAALASAPGHAAILGNLGRARLRRSDWEDALAALDGAINAAPDDAAFRLTRALALPFIAASKTALAAARERMEAEIEAVAALDLNFDDPAREMGMTNFLAPYHGRDDLGLQTRIADIYLRCAPTLAFTAPHCTGAKKTGARIKIGFVSANLAGHTIAKLNHGLITGLDGKNFEVFVFCFGPDRRGGGGIIDAIAAGADHFAMLPPHLGRARDIIAEAELDILYYPDIGMEPMTYFLAFARLAPVQCVTWGHPVTTGIPAMDYFVSSAAAEAADADAHYSEKLIRLDTFSSHYQFPEIPEAAKTPGDFGLGGGGAIYLCPQSLFKVHPDFDDMLGAILEADRQGRIVFIEGPVPEWGTKLRARFRATIGENCRRIHFLSRMGGADFQAVLALADVILDTPHFGGGSTTYEALAAGTPVITLPGRYLRSRLTLGLYNEMGMTQAIAGDAGDYARIAVTLATDAGARIEARRAIAETRGAIFANRRAISAHEDFFARAVAGGL